MVLVYVERYDYMHIYVHTVPSCSNVCKCIYSRSTYMMALYSPADIYTVLYIQYYIGRCPSKQASSIFKMYLFVRSIELSHCFYTCRVLLRVLIVLFFLPPWAHSLTPLTEYKIGIMGLLIFFSQKKKKKKKKRLCMAWHGMI